jgi:hypothetical protein
MPVKGLSDRLYADAITAAISAEASFTGADLLSQLSELGKHVERRGRVYESDLSVDAAAVHQSWMWTRARLTRDLLRSRSEQVWDAAHEEYRAVSLLANVATSLLQQGEDRMLLEVDRQLPGQEILRWRFVSLAMPVSILIAAVSARSGRKSGALRLLHPSMAPDHAVAHQHLHHAASLSFDEIWASVRLRALLEPADFRRRLRDKYAWCPGLHHGPCLRTQEDGPKQAKRRPVESARHMEEWGDLLFNAFIARGLLDRHAGHRKKLAECDHPGCKVGYVTLRAFLKGRSRPYSFTGTPYPWPSDRFRLGRRYWDAQAEGVFTDSQKKRTTFIREQTAEERDILARAFRYVRPEDEEPHDPKYEILFLQYLRVKTALHRLLVHPTGEHGLEKFLQHFSQIKIYEPRSDRLRPGKPDEPGLNVAATEYRVAPDAWLRELGRGEVDRRGRPRTIEEIPKGEKAGEAAWLIHFKRKPHDKDLLPLHGRSMREMEGEARLIGNALEQDPRRLRKLRGIDICGVEEQQPLWVCAEILRKLRRRSAEIAARRPGLKLEPLRLTLHAGEDFRWLTSGMRAVAEPFYWKLAERGDRIGHGIAVTLKPKKWWRQHDGEVIESTAIDRLQDLAFLAAYTDEVPAAARNERERSFNAPRTDEQDKWLAAEIRQAVKELGLLRKSEAEAKPDLVQQAKEFWRAIGGRKARRLIGSSTAPSGDDVPLHEKWLHRYFWNRAVQRRAHETIRLPVDSSTHYERDLLHKARLRLVRELARWQIPIESNPSSNLVVASLDAMASQDFLAQSPHKKRKAGHETLPWTISTDDPITFATSLADEYAYAWAGMVLREKDPFDPAHARALLDEAAATSMRTRFTVPEISDERR